MLRDVTPEQKVFSDRLNCSKELGTYFLYQYSYSQ